MPTYRVTLHAHLPPSPPASELQLGGFTRMAGTYGQAPEIQVDEVELSPGSDAPVVNRSGYLFYEDDQR